MKPIIIFISIFILTVISCTVQHFKSPADRVPIGIINPVIIQDSGKTVIEKIPVPVEIRGRDTVWIKETFPVIQGLDTAVVRQWFNDLNNIPIPSIMDDARVLAVVSQLGETLHENEMMVKQLIYAVQEKEKAEQTIQKTKSVQTDVPTIMLLCLLLMILLTNLVYSYRISKEQHEIKYLKSCRTPDKYEESE